MPSNVVCEAGADFAADAPADATCGGLMFWCPHRREAFGDTLMSASVPVTLCRKLIVAAKLGNADTSRDLSQNLQAVKKMLENSPEDGSSFYRR